MREIWRAVTRSSAYEVSNEGRVRRAADRLIVAPTLAASGYLVIHLSAPKVSSVCAVHTLVAEAFLGPRPRGMMVVHRNGEKGQNAATNLAYRPLGERKSRNPELMELRKGFRTLSRHQASEIKRRARLGESTKVLAEEFGVSSAHVSLIKHGRKWRSV